MKRIFEHIHLYFSFTLPIMSDPEDFEEGPLRPFVCGTLPRNFAHHPYAPPIVHNSGMRQMMDSRMARSRARQTTYQESGFSDTEMPWYDSYSPMNRGDQIVSSRIQSIRPKRKPVVPPLWTNELGEKEEDEEEEKEKEEKEDEENSLCVVCREETEGDVVGCLTCKTCRICLSCFSGDEGGDCFIRCPCCQEEGVWMNPPNDIDSLIEKLTSRLEAHLSRDARHMEYHPNKLQDGSKRESIRVHGSVLSGNSKTDVRTRKSIYLPQLCQKVSRKRTFYSRHDALARM